MNIVILGNYYNYTMGEIKFITSHRLEHPLKMEADREVELSEAEKDLRDAQIDFAHAMIKTGHILESLASGSGLVYEDEDYIMSKYKDAEEKLKSLRLKVSTAEHRLEILKAKKTFLDDGVSTNLA